MQANLFRYVGRGIFPASAIAVALALPLSASAAPITFQASGADAASIQATVDAFRAAVSTGGVNNGNTVGSLSDGRREVNWDGGGAAANATQFASPMNTFNTGGTTRGLVSTTPGGGFADQRPAHTRVRGHQRRVSIDLSTVQWYAALQPARKQCDGRALLRARHEHPSVDLRVRCGVYRCRSVEHLKPGILQSVKCVARDILRTDVQQWTLVSGRDVYRFDWKGPHQDRKRRARPQRWRGHGRGRPRRLHLQRASGRGGGARTRQPHTACHRRRGGDRRTYPAAPVVTFRGSSRGRTRNSPHPAERRLKFLSIRFLAPCARIAADGLPLAK